MSSIRFKPTISHFLMMGDSLSDRGTLDERYLFGFIPMSWLSGLTRSPYGRFTNGYTWTDQFSAMIASHFNIESALFPHHPHYDFNSADQADEVLTHYNHFQYLPHKHLDKTDVADKIISDARFTTRLRNSYTLDNDLYVKYNGRDLVRSYDEGGLTAHDYSWVPSTSISRFFSRIILSTLRSKREKVLAYDKKHAISEEQKKNTLVVEWSGANDLFTVNARPSKEEADKAIRERLLNAEILIRKGYRNVVLYNLPDLSLTPRYQNMQGVEGERERKNAHDVTEYFNQKLQRECAALQTRLGKENFEYSGCGIDIFNVNKIFSDEYQKAINGQSETFTADKLKTPLTSTKEYKNVIGKPSPGNGYMFYDDVHPSADMHALLSKKFYEFAKSKYHIKQPEPLSAKELVYAFKKKYSKKYRKDYFGFFNLIHPAGSFLANLEKLSSYKALDKILQHARLENGKRTREVLIELNWIDDNGKVNEEIPGLKTASPSLRKPGRL